MSIFLLPLFVTWELIPGAKKKSIIGKGNQGPGRRFNGIKKHHVNHHEKTSHQKVTIKEIKLDFRDDLCDIF